MFLRQPPFLLLNMAVHEVVVVTVLHVQRRAGLLANRTGHLRHTASLIVSGPSLPGYRRITAANAAAATVAPITTMSTRHPLLLEAGEGEDVGALGEAGGIRLLGLCAEPGRKSGLSCAAPDLDGRMWPGWPCSARIIVAPQRRQRH